MHSERFKELLDELDGNSLQTLKEKNAKYSTNGDCLHNFRSGAEIMGGTPAQACWGYLTKHLVALRDKVEKNDFSDREDFLEKCQDTINYIRFLWCIGNDDPNRENLHEMVDKSPLKTVSVYSFTDNTLINVYHNAGVELDLINASFIIHPLNGSTVAYSTHTNYYEAE